MKEKITVESLYKIADEEFSKYKWTEPDEIKRKVAFAIYEDAMICAEYMTKHRIPFLHYIGPFGETDLKVGDLVKIKVGSEIFTSSKAYKIRGSRFTSTRIHRVRIHNISGGCILEKPNEDGVPIRIPREKQIYWTTSEPALCVTNISNIMDSEN